MTSMASVELAFSLRFTSRARTVFLFLAKLSSKEDSCFPSIATIMERCGLSESTVKRALRDLREMGLLSARPRFRKDNSQTSNLYTLHIPVQAPDDGTVADAAGHNNCPVRDESVQPCDFGDSSAEQTPPPEQNDTRGVSPVNPHELVIFNKNIYSSLTDRHAREETAEMSESSMREAIKPQQSEEVTAAEEEKLSEILEGCELHCFDPAYRVMFYQAILSLYFSRSVKIGNARIPGKWIRRSLCKLNYSTLETAKNKLEYSEIGAVRNGSAYVRSVVFNSILESETDVLFHYASRPLCITSRASNW